MDFSKDRKRKHPDDGGGCTAAVTCNIGQPKPIDPGYRCELCRKEEQKGAVFERNICFRIEKDSSGDLDRTTLLRICDGCSEILNKLDKFRKQAFCSFKYLLNPGAGAVQPRICRFCFVTEDGLVEMFDEDGRALDLKLLDQMRDWLEIVFDARDSVTNLCRPCIRSVEALAVLGIGPSMDIVYLKKATGYAGRSRSFKPGHGKKDKRDMREGKDQNLLEWLQMSHEGRNFTVLTGEAEPRIQVVFEKYFFRLVKSFLTGMTKWKCVHNRLRFCSAEIEISPGGTGAVLKGRHSHAPGPEKLLEYPQGKGRAIIDGVERTFWLTYGASGKSPYTRTLFLGGHRYYMTKIVTEGSRWCCNRSWDTGCRVHLTVEGLFETIKTSGNEHTHDPCPEAKINRYLKDCGVVLDDENAQEDSSQKQVEEASIAEPDRAQNFAMKFTVDQKVQITCNGHDFQWRDEEAGWCCVWSKIRRCPVKIRLSPDGKLAVPVEPTREHNHSDEVVAILWQKFGKYLIYDEHESNDFYYKLSGCKSEHQPNRKIVYQGYRYRLATITDSGDSDWKCEQCDATVRVMGLFWIIDYRCLHSHVPLTLPDLNYDEDLLPYKSTELTASVPQSPSALLKLLSIDEPERNFQMHHHNNNLMKILQDGFEYCYTVSKPTYSLWKCFYSTIRGCGAALHVDNHGRIGTPAKSSQHNHSIELWDLYYHRLGPGSIRNESTANNAPFVFLVKPDFVRPLPHIIFQGHLFTMSFITELAERSKWRCVAKDCPVTANVTGLFEAIRIEGLPHWDEPMPEKEKRECIERYGTPDEF